MNYYPPSGFFFAVSIRGGKSLDASFQEIDGISMEMEMETIDWGGETGKHYQVPKGVKYSNLVLSRGVIIIGSFFADWCFETMQSTFEKKIRTKKVTVNLLDPKDADKSLASWAFFDAYPVKWKISKFNAQQSEIVTESIELAYTYFTYEPNG